VNVCDVVDPDATEVLVTDPSACDAPTFHHSNVTDIAVPSGSDTVADSVGVSVCSAGRLAPVTHVVDGVVDRAVTYG
jgi:hypothetical protein